MSRRISTLLMSASAIALMATAPVMAADNKNSPPRTQVEAKSGNQIEVSTLIGKNLKNLRHETIGEIESVIVGESGKVDAVIVSVGGFLGMGTREVAIDWNDLINGQNGDDIQTNLTKNDLKSLPEYKYEKSEYRKTAFRDGRYAELRNLRGATIERKTEWIANDAVRISKLIGANVVNSQGDTIGEVEDLVMNEGKPQLILSVGEFLGMGGHDVAVDFAKATVQQQRGDTDDVRVSVLMTKDQLKAMPKFDLKAWKTHVNQR